MAQRWAVLGGAFAVAVLATGIAGPSLARDKKIGWVGLTRDAKVEAVVGSNTMEFNKGHAQTGKQFWVNFEGGLLAKVSPLGNVGGIEYAAMMGYDGALSGVGATGAFAFDFSLGFPVTLFHQFTDGTEKLQIAVAPGFGFNYVHAYLYLKAKGALRVNDGITAEASWTWWPGPTSLSLEKNNTGYNLASTKGSVYIGADESALELFAEYVWGQEEVDSQGKGDPKLFGGQNPFSQTSRRDCCKNIRFGAGFAF